MASGKVKFFNAEKGFGFIVRDDGEPDMFVHVTAVQDAGLDTLLADQHVSFELGTNSKTGRTKAINLRVL
jgi:CspA family cold shock protein